MTADYAFSAEQGIYRSEWGAPIHLLIETDMVRQERSGDVAGEVTVRSTAPGDDRHLHTARTTLSGTRARSDLARHLSQRTSRVDLAALMELVERHFVRTIRAFRDGEPAILLRDAPQPLDAGYPLAPLAHASLPSIVFGDGGSGKSWLAMLVAASLQAGVPYIDGLAVHSTRNVAYLDWEMSAWEHRQRLRQVTGTEMPPLVYVPCVAPLRDSVDRLRRIARDSGISFWIVDSVAPACGGEPESAEVAAAYFNALRALGGGSLSVAHMTKGGDGAEHKPFGSAFWHNLARLTWFAKGTETPSGMTVGLFNRKNNIGRLHDPLGISLEFEGDSVRASTSDVAASPVLAERLPLWRRIHPLLRTGPMTLHEIAEELDASVEAVRLSVKRSPAFQRLSGPNGIERWGLAA